MIRVCIASMWILTVFCALTLFAQRASTAGAVFPEKSSAPVPPTPTADTSGEVPQGLTNFSSLAHTSVSIPARSALSRDLRIANGDVLDVSVLGATDFNSEVRVSENGAVTLPLLDEVPVAGMTASELAKDLKNRLLKDGYFNDPLVSVTVKEYAADGVSVLGEIRKPGFYPLLGPSKLFEVISVAGGTTATAGNKVTITHRDTPQQPETITLSFGEQGSRESNVTVTPGDTIVFEKAGLVYVVGDVRKPTGIVMSNPDLTVLQALAMAEGANHGAALTKAMLIRKTAQGPSEVPLRLNEMLSAKIPDVEVQPDDIIFIPSSAAKAAAKRGLEAALTAATALAIYRP